VKCTEEEAKTLLRPVLRTLKVMHSGDLGVRIIHRNIRPENLLQRVSKAGLMVELVLADFCCSSVEVKPEVKHPATASIYQAPKLPSIAGFAGAADGGLAASADCYAVGVTVMQLLGCLRVHAGLDDQAVQQQVVEFVDAPGDGEASAAVREFVGCCCGGGRGWLFAASRGRASSMTAAHLLETAWMRL
jgi:serine/threonine protein kinase